MDDRFMMMWFELRGALLLLASDNPTDKALWRLFKLAQDLERRHGVAPRES